MKSRLFVFSLTFSLRNPEEMQPEQYQSQLDVLLAEYAQLQERTEAIENVNKEGGKFIRQAKVDFLFICNLVKFSAVYLCGL